MSLSNKDIILITDYINAYRKKHNAKLINHSDVISKFSKSFSDELLKNNAFQHSNNKLYGENLYKSWSSSSLNSINLVSHAKNAIDSWYNEIKLYNFEKGDFNYKTGHFTQLIWNNSTEYGIGISVYDKTVIVCMNYNPRGNIIGKFKENVFKLQ